MSTETLAVAICTAQTIFARGGSELLVAALEREIRARGHRVEVVAIPFTWSKDKLLENALLWRLINVEADLVIATNFPSYFVNHPNKVIWLFHQHRKLYDLYSTPFSEYGGEPGDDEIRGVIHTADIRFISESRRVFTISRTVAERLRKFNGIVGEPLYPPLHLYRPLFCREYGGFVLMPTRLEMNKRPDLLVEAMRFTRADTSAVIVGSGGREQDLRRRVARYGLESRVHFAGYVDEAKLIDLYASCGAVFYAPLDEDYGYVTLEAFHARKPVITTVDAGGVLEFVSDEQTGLVAETDPEAIAQRIDRLTASREFARLLGESGYDRVKNIRWENAIPRLIEQAAP